MKLEMPLAIRVVEGFLFCLKKVLISWGYGKQEVKVEVEGANKHLLFMQEKVLEVKIEDGKLHLQWHSSWKSWDELQSSKEILDLIDKSNERLNLAKGHGKGKTKVSSSS